MNKPCTSIALLGISLILGTERMASAQVYLHASFRDATSDGLHFATSADGYDWNALKDDQSFMKPTWGSLRDPSIVLGPNNVYRMAWTSVDNKIGYSTSTDLIHWSPQRLLPFADSIVNAENAWAPEIFYDSGRNNYQVIWSTSVKTGADSLHNHRLYSTTTADFKTFSPTEKFFDPGYSCIDGSIIKINSSQYALMFKDERDDEKVIKYAISSDCTPGSFDGRSIYPFPQTNPSYEGPQGIKIGNNYFVYYDHYSNTGVPKYYGAMRSSSFTNWFSWRDIYSQVSFPEGTRHGCVLEIPQSVLEKLQAPASFGDGGFESVVEDTFTSWSYTSNTAGGAVATPVSTTMTGHGNTIAKMLKGSTDGGSLWQKVSDEGLREFTLRCDFAVLPVSGTDARSMGIWTCSDPDIAANQVTVDSIRVNSQNHLQYAYMNQWIDTGLVANVTGDTGVLGLFDGETPVFNHLTFIGTGYGTDARSLTIILNGQKFIRNGLSGGEAIRTIGMVGDPCAADWLVDNVSFSTVPEPSSCALSSLAIMCMAFYVCRKRNLFAV